ncbi:hypothetical protein GCM10027268_01620 [Brachybacterium huguangmaarense]
MPSESTESGMMRASIGRFVRRIDEMTDGGAAASDVAARAGAVTGEEDGEGTIESNPSHGPGATCLSPRPREGGAPPHDGRGPGEERHRVRRSR